MILKELDHASNAKGQDGMKKYMKKDVLVAMDTDVWLNQVCKDVFHH